MRHIVGHDAREEHGRRADEAVAAALFAERCEFVPLEDASLRLRMAEERRARNVHQNRIVEVDIDHAVLARFCQSPHGTPGDLVRPDFATILHDLLAELGRKGGRVRAVSLRVEPDEIRLLGFLSRSEVPFIPSAVIVRRHFQEDGDESVDHDGVFGTSAAPQLEAVVGMANPPKPARKAGEGVSEGLLGERGNGGREHRRHG